MARTFIVSYIRVARKWFAHFGIYGLFTLIRSTLPGETFSVRNRNSNICVTLRKRSIDRVTFRTVMMEGLYENLTAHDPKWIVDLGANIGLATVYFALRYPSANIIAVEPDKSNFDLLALNVEPFQNRVHIINAAIGPKEGWATILRDGKSFDCYQIEYVQPKQRHSTAVVTVGEIFAKYNLEYVDLLKVDIEGFEKYLFRSNLDWLKLVGTIGIELHEQIAPGATRIFVDSVLPLGFTLNFSQETVIAKRAI